LYIPVILSKVINLRDFKGLLDITYRILATTVQNGRLPGAQTVIY